MKQNLDPELRGFFKRLIDYALRSAIHSVFLRMPWMLALALIFILIGVAIVFKLY